ncbi:hypothetical protein JCGZ_13202 [Jatropha curcas]|uniref:Uncharacterized protein n=1 Tax=Jatropha curcas TaxID=180498 RepID=A0A067K870_JATCU|nr:hypothetical protein JCGZ_13202 [Jatropha curcas]
MVTEFVHNILPHSKPGSSLCRGRSTHPWTVLALRPTFDPRMSLALLWSCLLRYTYSVPEVYAIASTPPMPRTAPLLRHRIEERCLGLLPLLRHRPEM